MFEDRSEAGERLAVRLETCGEEVDLVLAIPRGGLPVARPVADYLAAELDIVAAKKLGMPWSDEFAFGAAAGDGSAWIDEELVEAYDLSPQYVEKERERAAETAREKLSTYRGDRAGPDVAGRRVVVVDDGVATGATARACLRQVRNADAARVLIAVPVGPPSSLDALREVADEVVSVESPANFGAVDQFYREFTQITDEEALACLRWEATEA